MTQLNTIELDVAKEIINIGLGKAADSLSFFSQQKVIIRNSDFIIKKHDPSEDISSKKGDSLYVLTTSIKGDLSGVCFLIFNEQEATQLIEISLPKSILEDESQKEMMSEAVLKEADNIISASVITQFSDLLKINMYGDVPHLDIINQDELTSFLIKGHSSDDYLLQINAQFHTEKIDFKPDFIWFLDNKFVSGIQDFVKHEPNLEKLREYPKS